MTHLTEILRAMIKQTDCPHKSRLMYNSQYCSKPRGRLQCRACEKLQKAAEAAMKKEGE